MKRFAYFAFLLVLIFSFASWVGGFQFLGAKWPQPSTTFYVNIPGANGLWNNGFETAVARWNTATPYFHFSTVNTFRDPCLGPESGPRNGVKFDTTDCGTPFGSSTLAVTHTWERDGFITQSGIVFNSTKSWDVYSGAYQAGSHAGVQEFVRVAVHELGHGLGLDHEDSVTSIMVSTIAIGSRIEVPQLDDKNGVQVLYGPPLDLIKPTVTITTPTSAPTYSTTIGAINLGGTASDNVGVTEMDWTSNRGGLAGNCTFGGFGSLTWTCTSIPLFAGTNILTVTATDAQGNSGTDVLTVTYSPPDTEPPTILITSPTSNATFATNAPFLVLSGSASDNVIVTQVSFSTDGGDTSPCNLSLNPPYSWTCPYIPLRLGPNTVTITAWDAAGNANSATIAVTSTPIVVSAVKSTPGSAGNATITWTTSVPTMSHVEFASPGDSLRVATEETTPPGTEHTVTLSNLVPNASYTYRIYSNHDFGSTSTGDFTFSTFSIPNLGGYSRITPGGPTPLTTGYGRIQPGVGSTTPSGVAIFGYRPADVLVSETGVPDSPAIASGRTYAEVNPGGVDTGLAVINPNSASVRVFFDLRDTSGNIVKSGSKDFAPGEHSAAFIDQDPYFSGPDFQGTISFSSTLPISLIAIRGFWNERTPSEFLMSTLPVIDLSQPALGGTQVIPHFAAGGGFTTQILLVNPTGLSQTGTIEFRDRQGVVTTVFIDGAPSSGGAYTIAPNGTAKLIVTGLPTDIATGSVRMIPAGGGPAPTPLVLFSFKPGGITVSEATVPVTMGSAFRMFVQLSPTELINAGLAIANTGGTPGTLNLSVTSLDGTPVASASLPIGANEQILGFLDALVPALAGQTLQGVLRITSTVDVSVVGLRSHYNERSPQRDFLMATTPPTLESSLPGSAERFFPQIADAGGFTTQVILFSGTAGQSANGDLTFFTGLGAPLNLVLR